MEGGIGKELGVDAPFSIPDFRTYPNRPVM
jgi:hypothetical protein